MNIPFSSSRVWNPPNFCHGRRCYCCRVRLFGCSIEMELFKFFSLSLPYSLIFLSFTAPFILFSLCVYLFLCFFSLFQCFFSACTSLIKKRIFSYFCFFFFLFPVFLKKKSLLNFSISLFLLSLSHPYLNFLLLFCVFLLFLFFTYFFIFFVIVSLSSITLRSLLLSFSLSDRFVSIRTTDVNVRPKILLAYSIVFLVFDFFL